MSEPAGLGTDSAPVHIVQTVLELAGANGPARRPKETPTHCLIESYRAHLDTLSRQVVHLLGENRELKQEVIKLQAQLQRAFVENSFEAWKIGRLEERQTTSNRVAFWAGILNSLAGGLLGLAGAGGAGDGTHKYVVVAAGAAFLIASTILTFAARRTERVA